MSALELPQLTLATAIVDTLQGTAALCPLVILFPLIAFLVISFVTSRHGSASAAVCLTSFVGALAVSLGLAAEQLGTQAPIYQKEHLWLGVGEPLSAAISVGLLIDPLSSLTSVMVCFIAILVAVYSYGYMTTEIGHFPTQDDSSLSRFYGYLSLFVFSMLGLVFSSNLLQIYIFWELVGVCSYFLIGFWYFKKSAADANKKSFIVTKFSDLFFLMGVLAVGVGAGTFRFTDLDQIGITALEAQKAVAQGLTPEGAAVLPFALFGMVALPLILIAFGPIGKSAQFPLHVWLPDAMEGPTPVSALIHAATMVAAGIYLVARLFGLYQAVPEAAAFVAFIGSFTALLAALMAVVQNDIKKVLAYSTISQLGFMLAALGSGAYTAGLFHLFTHAFFKALLFLGAGAIIVACHNNDMWRMGGLARHLPKTHFTFLIGCLALAGIPPLAGFWSKDEIMAGVSGHPLPFLLLAAAAFLTAFYVTRLYCVAFRGEYRGEQPPSVWSGPVPESELPAPLSPSRDGLGMEPEWTEEQADVEVHPPACLGAKQEKVPHHHGPPHDTGSSMLVPLMILSVFAALLGFIGMPNGMLAQETNLFHKIIWHPSEAAHDFHWEVMALSIFIAVLGVLVGWSLYGSHPEAGERKLRRVLGGFHRVLRQKFYFDHLWAWLVAKTMFAGARLGAFFDDSIVDGGVRIFARGTGALGEKIRQEQTGQVAHYLFMLVVALLMLVALVSAVQPDFALSPSRIFNPGEPFPGGGLLP